MGSTAQSRAASYNTHYRTAGWRALGWTREKLEAYFAYALSAAKGGSINGNEIQCGMRLLGVPNLSGRTILDYCCGAGITAIYFAFCGAKVHAFDASPVAVEIARRSAQLSGVCDAVEFEVSYAQELPYASETFDGVFCRSALHIVVDYADCPPELSRVLKRGGKAVFCEEALAHNPLFKPIRYMRRRRWRSFGGRPLSYGDVAAFGQSFSETVVHHFNLLGQAKQLFEGQLLRRGELRRSVRRFLQGLERIDRAVLATAPWLRRFCGKVVVEYTK